MGDTATTVVLENMASQGPTEGMGSQVIMHPLARAIFLPVIRLTTSFLRVVATAGTVGVAVMAATGVRVATAERVGMALVVTVSMDVLAMGAMAGMPGLEVTVVMEGEAVKGQEVAMVVTWR
ncbi:hypothetical protein J8C02_03680 [Chloracidobacterium sp. MS 40/45]|uniref:hypothetical protein n=1 Tax=Chloracidobacterium aggregatum TaxID=2851959 RepID=UPI001B8C9A05|nr:hypothetical protein [Chloracidobacterium aggregatum]QUW00605.1 hypothetical protein J8C02_03680 [Chloracidobacterium sp. MS 40/45]